MHPYLVPLVMMLAAWALYATDELAKILDEPFGSRSRRSTVPVEMYVPAAASGSQCAASPPPPLRRHRLNTAASPPQVR